MKPNQRFIAGARCPKCQSMDSLLLNQDDQSIECVDCDYTQTAEERDAEQNAPKPEKKNSNQKNSNTIAIKIIND